MVAILAMAAVVAVLGFVPTQNASAAEMAVNSQNIQLRFPSYPGDVACTNRRIALATGNYHWRIGNSIDGWDSWPSRDIYLTAGTYLWMDCLSYYESASVGGVYSHESSLDPLNGGAVARLYAYLTNGTSRGTRWIVYGSTLQLT